MPHTTVVMLMNKIEHGLQHTSREPRADEAVSKQMKLWVCSSYLQESGACSIDFARNTEKLPHSTT